MKKLFYFLLGSIFFAGTAYAATQTLDITAGNTFTGLQQFNGNASSTQLTTTGSTYLATTGGNVGIGTTSPAQLLSVGNGDAAGGLYYSATGLAVGSSTPGFSFSVGNGTPAFYVASTGKIVGYDATNAWSGRITPTRNLTLQTGTTTAWTATTSGAYIPSAVVPFAGTIRTAKCATDAGTLNIDIYHTSTHLSLLNASTTVGTVSFTSNNTVTAGEVVYLAAGTPATSPTTVSCTLSLTETP